MPWAPAKGARLAPMPAQHGRRPPCIGRSSRRRVMAALGAARTGGCRRNRVGVALQPAYDVAAAPPAARPSRPALAQRIAARRAPQAAAWARRRSAAPPLPPTPPPLRPTATSFTRRRCSRPRCAGAAVGCVPRHASALTALCVARARALAIGRHCVFVPLLCAICLAARAAAPARRLLRHGCAPCREFPPAARAECLVRRPREQRRCALRGAPRTRGAAPPAPTWTTWSWRGARRTRCPPRRAAATRPNGCASLSTSTAAQRVALVTSAPQGRRRRKPRP